MAHPRTLAGIATLALVAVTGCSSSSGATSHPSGTASPTQDASTVWEPPAGGPELPAGMRLPFEDYSPSNWDHHKIEVAYYAVLSSCLNRYVDDTGLVKPSFHGPASILTLRYGVHDDGWAGQHGYWWPGDDIAGPKGSGSQITMDPVLMSGTAPTYKGKPVPPGGCAQEANDNIFGIPGISQKDKARIVMDTQAISSGLLRKTNDDPKTQAAQRAWTTCMAGKGYRFPDSRTKGNLNFAASDSLSEALGKTRPDPGPGSAEAKLATADAQCTTSSGVVTVSYETESRLERETIAKDPAKWADIKQWYQQRMAAVQKTLDERRLTP
ncbi:hypothetical protein ACFXDJ_15460 [Streptomyces sp. NPDC059443]|uniref:hypothetical protein n=1 Tax=unclassified Streptomyces TaxID=2593676 RepID=UPI00369C9881